MGRLDRIKQAQQRSNEKSFHPTDLNEGNVQKIFNDCLATKDTTEYLKSILYQKAFGYEQDSNPILFDKGKLLDNLKNIRYLYGQLKTTHCHSNTINTSKENTHNAMTNYKGEVWTEKEGIIKQFFHLGVVSDTIYSFTLNGNSGFKDVNIQPTLSPKDEGFAEWWETHKSEWEGR